MDIYISQSVSTGVSVLVAWSGMFGRFLPQVSCPDVTLDSDHGGERLPTARPQTPVSCFPQALQRKRAITPHATEAGFYLPQAQQNSRSPCAFWPPAHQMKPDPNPCACLLQGVWPDWKWPPPLVEKGRGFCCHGKCPSVHCCLLRGPHHHSHFQKLKRQHLWLMLHS